MRVVFVMHYNALGAMLDKTDVGVYAYPASGVSSVRPHAVSAVASTGYTYDANGNVVGASSGKYRSIAYTSFNLPDSQNGTAGPSNSPRYTWQYDADHQRVRETHVDGSGTRTTYYMHPDNAGGLSYEYEVPVNGTPTSRHYLTANGMLIGMLETQGAPTSPSASSVSRYEYWHRDHLGSVAVTTDNGQTVTNRYAYDPFGKRRQPDGNYDAVGSIVADYPSATDRGFTSHEHLDDVGIVHMNGRLYDPNTARFLQADPIMQRPLNLQSYQRYSYVFNNPLNATDPTGMFSIRGALLHLFIQHNPSKVNLDGRAAWRNPYVRVATAIVVAYFTGYYNYGTLEAPSIGIFQAASAASTEGFANAALAGFAGGAIQSGTLKGGLTGLYSAALFYGAGSLGATLGEGFAPGDIGAVGLHAAAGCVSSEVTGGECGSGALSAAFAEAAVKLDTQSDRFANVVIHAVVGGTASALGGGKFANGAFTGAYGYLFNNILHDAQSGAGYGSADKGEHHYYQWTLVASGCSSGGCDLASNAFSSYSAPSLFMQPITFEEGATRLVFTSPLADAYYQNSVQARWNYVPLGFITQTTLPDGSILNTTLSAHMACCGTVTRTQVVINDRLYVFTVGRGTNPSFLTTYNEIAGPKVFRELDLQLQRATSGK